MSELVPIKIKIKLGYDKQRKQYFNIYPDFNSLPTDARKDMDWCCYIDCFGTGQNYDRCCNHETKGEWSSLIAVPAEFADAAIAMFPNEVARLTDSQAQDFWDNHAHRHETEIDMDHQALMAWDARKRQGEMIEMKDDYKNAMNPDHPAPGLSRNPRKTWVSYKKYRQITVVQPDGTKVPPPV